MATSVAFYKFNYIELNPKRSLLLIVIMKNTIISRLPATIDEILVNTLYQMPQNCDYRS